MSDASEDLFDPINWDDYCNQLLKIGNEIIKNSPENALDRVEGYRYLARLVNYSLSKFLDPPNIERPIIDYNSPRIGGDNPDFLYGQILISGSNDYRIHGNKNDAFNISFGSYYGGLGSDKGLQCSGNIQLKELSIGNDGGFDILVSQNNNQGNWLPTINETNSILIRQTILHRDIDTPADINIELINSSFSDQIKQPLNSSQLADSLNLSGMFVEGVVKQFLHWTHNFKSKPNEINPTDPELLKFANGDPDTFYHNGYFELNSDEVLLVELDPPDCEYWNIQVTNYWLESLDYLDFCTHFNHATAKADNDGKYRFIISPKDPGLYNWINTAEHYCGCISLRWNLADNNPNAKTELLSFENAVSKIAKLRG